MLAKFSSAEGIKKILEFESIFVTSPLDFNDPFEMRPAWTNAHDKKFRDERNRLNLARTGMRTFVALEGDQIAEIPPIPASESMPQMDVGSQLGISDEHNGEIFRLLHDQFRVLCLVRDVLNPADSYSETEDRDTLMWAHYGDQFQGACIILDQNKFVDKGIRDDGFEVKYPQERKSVPYSFYGLNLEDPPVGDATGGIAKSDDLGLYVTQEDERKYKEAELLRFLRLKSPAWKYENELRFIYRIDELRESDNYSRVPFRCGKCVQCKNPEAKQGNCLLPGYRDAVSLDADAVQAVILGPDIHPQDAEELFAILGQKRYAHVDCYWANFHSEKYAMQYMKKGQEYIGFIQKHRNQSFNQAKGHKFYHDGQPIGFAEKKGVCIDVATAQKRYLESVSERKPPVGYADNLKDHLSNYKRQRLGISGDGIHKGSGRPYGHILPVNLKKLNILEGIRAEFWRDFESGGMGAIKLHTDFHHLNSSQAMAFNLFYPFIREADGLRLIMKALGVDREQPGQAIFEYEPDPNEKTNFDFAVKYEDGSCVTCEVKLTESGFGAAKNDTSHRTKFEEHYQVKAEELLTPEKAESTEFFKDYQLYRNVLHLADNPKNISVFLHPQANQNFSTTKSKLDDALRPEFKSRARICHLEDLVDQLARIAESDQVRQYLNAFREKYAIPNTAK